LPIVDGSHLTLDDIVAVARHGESVALGPDVLARVAASQEFADRVAEERPIYCRSTGVGANRDLVVPDPDSQPLQLLRSHATSSGHPRSAERVRAMLLVRLNELAADGNGLHPRILEALTDMITENALPPVREGGSVGTADLAALATTALVLSGEKPSDPPMTRTASFVAGDALTFMSSNAAVLADAALAIADIDQLARSLMVVAAMGYTAVNGNPEAFSPAVEVATPCPGAAWVCKTMRALVDNDAEPARIKDPIGLRTLRHDRTPARQGHPAR
jgi:histidine ammonia-lyase